MCGFVGFVDKARDKKKIVKDMADIIVHRGPDSDGYYTDNLCAIGFRRLSIIDLDGGNWMVEINQYIMRKKIR